MFYTHLLGGLLSSITPYLFMIGCGYFFGRVKLLQKEGLNAFAKMVVEIFLPVYLFIHVCRSTFVHNFQEYGILIISFLFYFIIAGCISFLWAYFSKMDLRYRFTFICMTSFVDIRRLHYLYINSFCYLLTIKTKEERAYCSSVVINTEIHTFFQGILIWYLGFNLIRVDRTYTRHSDHLWDKINRDDNIKTETNESDSKDAKDYFAQEIELVDKNPLTHEDKNKIKEIYNQYTVIGNNPKVANQGTEIEKKNETPQPQNPQNAEPQHEHQLQTQTPIQPVITEPINDNQNKNQHQIIHVIGRQSFYNKISEYSKAKFFKNDSIWKEILYILMRPPLIALFTGFVVGFIRPIRIWLFDTTTPVYLFFDTFNNIANCNILIGFLVMGANLSLETNDDFNKMNILIKVRKIDYVVHLVLKIIIMPFFGVIFTYISHLYFPENKALSWSCFIQWVMPTSHDIMQIIQLKDINVKFVAICFVIQYFAQAIINNLIHIPPVMSVLGILEGGS